MQNDNIISGWRNGADSVRGFQNPAGPLFMEGAAATEAAMTNPNNPNITMTSLTAVTCLPMGGCCLCA